MRPVRTCSWIAFLPFWLLPPRSASRAREGRESGRYVAAAVVRGLARASECGAAPAATSAAWRPVGWRSMWP